MDELQKLEKIMAEVFEIDNVSISRETTAKDISEWDSVNHIYLVVEIEKAFNIKFSTHEIQTWKNTGDIINSIEIKLRK